MSRTELILSELKIGIKPMDIVTKHKLPVSTVYSVIHRSKQVKQKRMFVDSRYCPITGFKMIA